MAELKCPHCGQAFTVDDTEVSSIIQQIRDKEFQKDLKSRVSEMEERMREKHFDGRIWFENTKDGVQFIIRIPLYKKEKHTQ